MHSDFAARRKRVLPPSGKRCRTGGWQKNLQLFHLKKMILPPSLRFLLISAHPSAMTWSVARAACSAATPPPLLRCSRIHGGGDQDERIPFSCKATYFGRRRCILLPPARRRSPQHPPPFAANLLPRAALVLPSSPRSLSLPREPARAAP
jgi:hypothetical protein